MTERGKPILAWGIKTKGQLSATDISDDRDDLIAVLNRPAGQSVVRIRISEVAKTKRRTPAQGSLPAKEG